MNRVLFITYYFPPGGGAATQRPAKFCKYFANFGWQPVVITRRSSRSWSGWDLDRGQLAEIEKVLEWPYVRSIESKQHSKNIEKGVRNSYNDAFLATGMTLSSQQ